MGEVGLKELKPSPPARENPPCQGEPSPSSRENPPCQMVEIRPGPDYPGARLPRFADCILRVNERPVHILLECILDLCHF